MAVLELVDVSKSFGGLSALSGVSFAVKEREILGLIGPNGAGKTTLFNVITAVFPPTQGRILFRGESIEGRPTHRIVRRGISRTFQNIRLFPQLSARENVMVGRHARSQSGSFRSVLRTGRQQAEERAIREKTDELLALTGLAGCEDLLARELAYGHQRRLEIARALAAEPSLLLLDEPAAGMNEGETRDIHDLIVGIRAMGVTVILIEHDMSLIMRVCDRLVVLNFGRRIAEGTPEEIRANPEVVEAYLGREEDGRDA